ncbi:MAG: MarR family transcriptional regulator [Candidatus Aureabacteria bacterium]|nr:MarR family transcriptional regulator [Candidatus Auribacterota bacterium]
MKTELSHFAEDLITNFVQIRRGVMKQFFSFSNLDIGKITIPQMTSLWLIDSSGSMKMKDLATELNITLPATTGMINRLYKLGLVNRILDESDRRIVKIRLTLKAREIINAMKKQQKEMIEGVFGKLSEKERQDYLNIVKKIRNIIYNPHSV